MNQTSESHDVHLSSAIGKTISRFIENEDNMLLIVFSDNSTLLIKSYAEGSSNLDYSFADKENYLE